MINSSRLARSKALALATCMLVAVPGYASIRLKVGDAPPPNLGPSVQLRNYRGRVVIIAFWASWCPPCRAELTMLARLQKVATRRKLVIFAVDWEENTARFREIRHALHGIGLALISDPYGYLGGKYDVHSIPHMVLLGRDGRIAAIRIGYSKREIPALVAEINALLVQAR